MTATVERSDWHEVDDWWKTSEMDVASFDGIAASGVLDNGWLEKQWGELDSWWVVNVEVQREALVELQDVLGSAQKEWRGSESNFDEDPLEADWASESRNTGPLRIGQEENWSHWLAHVLRESPSAFSRHLFDDEFDHSPTGVEREVHLIDRTGSDRYADIIVFYKGRGISIEVKRGDTHYEKTLHTASLVESKFGRDWEHILLVPDYRMTALRQSFGERLEEPTDGRPVIESDQSNDITVLRWQDVSEALRMILLSDTETRAHWEASAYLLCAHIEQQMAQFVPEPVISQVINATDVVQATSAMSLTGSDIEEQVAYLKRTITGDEDE